MPMGITRIHKEIMCQSSLTKSFSFVFFEFNRVANLNEAKTMILVQSTFQIPK